MSAEIIPIKTIAAPSMAAAFGYQESDLTEGASLGFPVLTYRGKVWRVTHKGDTTALITPDGDPIPSVRVIILRANANLSKIYYEKQYVEGDNAPPDCYSMDGERPDSGISTPQSATCAACPKAAWGSKISDDGKELKACQDSRRLVVVPSNDIANEALGGPMLLRVPAASLGNLVAYDNLLKKANAAYFGVATKVSFDMEAAYPKLVFEYDGPNTEKLTPEHAQQIMDLRNSDEASRILSTRSAQETDAHVDAEPPRQPAKQAVAPPPVVEVEETPPPAPPVTEPAEEVTPAATVEESEVKPATTADVDALVDGLLNG